MQEAQFHFIFGICCVGIFCACVSIPSLRLPTIITGRVGGDYESGTMLFVGDIMLGRAVERISAREGRTYPFLGTAAFLMHADVTVGNFEAAIPLVHVPTPDMSFRLAVESEFLPILKEYGFDILGLANNHAFDFGMSGFENTYARIRASDMQPVGDPRGVSELSIALTEAGDARIGILALHAVDRTPPAESIRSALHTLRGKSDIEIAYVHFGSEYERGHTPSQEALAHMLIDEGVDAVIGHHPHVVEDIEIYQGKPIFYSLGNFIFDQYFDPLVEEGLAILLTIESNTLTYTLVPVESTKTRSQPQLLPVQAARAYVEALFLRSEGVAPYERESSLVFTR